METHDSTLVRVRSFSCNASQWIQLKVASNAHSGESCVAFRNFVSENKAVVACKTCVHLSDPRDILSRSLFLLALISFQRARNVGLRPKEREGKKQGKAGKSRENRGRSSPDVLDGFVTCTTATVVVTLKVELDYHPDSIKPPSESPCEIIWDVAFRGIHVLGRASNGDMVRFYVLKCTLMMWNSINEKGCDIS